MSCQFSIKQLCGSALIGLLGSVLGSAAYADPGDEVCFPLYRKGGAIPQTEECIPTASSATPVGMGTYWCLGAYGVGDSDAPGGIERYCGGLPGAAGRSCEGQGNPVHAATGNKYQIESDYSGTGLFPLTFVRTYNSTPSAAPGKGLGSVWRSNYQPELVVADSNTRGVYRDDGKILYFTRAGTDWIPAKSVADKLVEVKNGTQTTGWIYTRAAGDTVETYNANGMLVSVAARNGQTHTLAYSDATTPPAIAGKAGLLISVTDHFGRQLKFTYDTSHRTATLTDPAGQVYTYGYDAAHNLTSVTYPGGKKRSYWYNEQEMTAGSDLPHMLTGITDENQVRFATFKYEPSGKAVSTEHAGGNYKFSFTYSQPNVLSQVTDPLGAVRTHRFEVIAGAVKNTGIDQPGGAGCNAASNSTTYDSNGNIKSRTDFNGNRTNYSYDLTRNLETQRVEAVGTAQARTITTEWHPSFRLPARVAEPRHLTIYNYDAKGNLLKKVERATSDASGAQAFSASLVGGARLWNYTYNNAGQVLTVTGPRLDVTDKTVYTYSQGNLATIANAAGHVTTLSNYDAHGRVGRVTDPNGLITDLTYSPRGWLMSAKTGGETTTYDYDAVGQLTKISLPGGSSLTYHYDDAHRLTGIGDSLGNRIDYALDGFGNRTGETTRDPNGLLARQVTRVYDALNRIQQITGGVK